MLHLPAMQAGKQTSLLHARCSLSPDQFGYVQLSLVVTVQLQMEEIGKSGESI